MPFHVVYQAGPRLWFIDDLASMQVDIECAPNQIPMNAERTVFEADDILHCGGEFPLSVFLERGKC